MNIQPITSWQARAIAAYKQTQANGATSTAFAARLKHLTGHTIDPQAIHVDDDTGTATLNISGVLFQMRKQELVIVRACPSCGLGRYESTPIANMAELGFALSAWQPPCPNCTPEDPQEM